MKPWLYLIESDAELRKLERSAKSRSSGMPEKVRYLDALNRHGRPPDLTIASTARNVRDLIQYLWKNKLLALVCNKRYPFGRPGEGSAVRGVRFLAAALRGARGNTIRGVRFSTFFNYILRWLTKNRQESRMGPTRGRANSPIGNLIHNMSVDDFLHDWGDDNEYLAVVDGLEFPTPDAIQQAGGHYGDLVTIGRHVNGGAIWRQNTDDTIYIEGLFDNPGALALAWAEYEQAHEENQEQPEEDYALPHLDEYNCSCASPRTATCNNCDRSWCDRCDPSRGCHYCEGRGYSTAALPQEWLDGRGRADD